MAMSFAKASPDGIYQRFSLEFSILKKHVLFFRKGKSSLSAGSTSIRLPGLSELNSDSDSSSVLTKVLESKDNPYLSATGNSNVQGSVVTIILSNSDGSEMPVTNTTKPIAIRLTRPADKQPKPQENELRGISFQYHKVTLPEDIMTLSIYIFPNFSPMDTYAIYISHNTNESLLEPPTETKFDLLFVVPNKTAIDSAAEVNPDDEFELRHTVFMPPGVHRGNGTYIVGVRLISKFALFSLEN